MNAKRYAVAGVSGRAITMFMDHILTAHGDSAALVAMLDKDHGRMERFNKTRKLMIPSFSPDEFDDMVHTARPHTIIVACPDAFHHHYIVKALQHDLDVIVEKPLTIDEERCRTIARAAADSKGHVTVTFNYRYSPAATRIRELIADGRLGRIINIELSWYLNTFHGKSYFQRWHRRRDISGGLSVHKACHHLDLVAWWTGQEAVEVFAYGGLDYYGPRGPHNPLSADQIGDGRTCEDCDVRRKCRYFMRWQSLEEQAKKQTIETEDHLDAIRQEQYHGYSQHQCIYDPGINIEDNYGALIKYDSGAYLTYTLNASLPYEGFRLTMNGTAGRIEYTELHGTNILPYSEKQPEQMPVTYIPLFGGRERIDIINPGGDHHGADPLIREDLFDTGNTLYTVDRKAGLVEGIDAVLTGVAVHRSVNEHKAISVETMRNNVFE